MDNGQSNPEAHSVAADRYANSALVVAHPDDEILFFSSVIEKVDIVIVCFLGNPRKPERRSARMRVLDNYPLQNIQTLDIDTSGASHFVDWNNPIESQTGLEIPNAAAQAAYELTYRAAVDQLRNKLVGYDTVYTHNPWGEYGHADHVQVHRAVDSLATELGYSVLFSNYVSPRSMPLALPYLSKTGYRESTSIPTSIGIAHKARDLYIREDCWTVPDDFSWPEYENFNSKTLADDDDGKSEKSYLFALNFIPWRYRAAGPRGLRQRISRNLRRIKTRTFGA